jgi:glycosyltransferase involved in cell wall biosynthesis
MPTNPSSANGRTRPLRIAYALQNVGGVDFGLGLSQAVPVRETLRGLRQAGHSVSALMLRGQSVVGMDNVDCHEQVWQLPQGLPGTRPFKRVEGGIRRVQRELRLPYLGLFDLYRFYRACLGGLPKFDLCHELNGLFTGGAALACRRLGKPYILSVDADILLERDQLGQPVVGLQRRLAAWETRLSYQAASRIICVSEPARQNLIDAWQVDPHKIEVVANGVDTQLFRPIEDSRALRAQLGIGDGPVVGFVGAFTAWHGLDLLIESFARVWRRFPAARLLLVGDGPGRQLVDSQIAAHGLQPAVCMTGLVPQTAVPALLACADVTVLPYPRLLKELWFSPLKLYEYMSAARAIVASGSGQIAQVIQHGHTGLLVEAGDVAELTDAICSLIENAAERARLGSNARAQAVASHSWHNYVQRLEAIYRSVLHPLPARPTPGRSH